MARACRVYHAGPAWSDPLHGASTLLSEVHQESRLRKARRQQKKASKKKSEDAPKHRKV